MERPATVGTINKQTKKVLLQETKILEVKSYGGGACIMTCFLQYSKVGNEEFLEGTYTKALVFPIHLIAVKELFF